MPRNNCSCVVGGSAGKAGLPWLGAVSTSCGRGRGQELSASYAIYTQNNTKHTMPRNNCSCVVGVSWQSRAAVAWSCVHELWQKSWPRAMARSAGPKLDLWQRAVAKNCGQELWPRAVARSYGQERWPEDVARSCGQKLWAELWPRVATKNYGQELWPRAVAMSCGQELWPGAVAKNCGQKAPQEATRDHKRPQEATEGHRRPPESKGDHLPSALHD